MDDDSEEDEVASGKLINLDFEPFPENCEVVSLGIHNHLSASVMT